MDSALGLIETWVRRLATVGGLLVIVLPLVRVWSSRTAQRGRTSGGFLQITRWPAIFALAIAYIAVGILLWKPIPLILPAGLRLIMALVGSVLYFPGIFIYAWGFRTLGSMFGVSSGMAAQLYAGHRLIEQGPYASVRHPMYLSVILAALGALLIFRTWAMAVYAPSAFAVVVRARREERLLADEFGDAWAEYASRVPPWIPKLRS